jgi:predicted dehydrogenase
MPNQLIASPDQFPGIPRVGIGMIGYALMGKAHSNAFIKLPHMMYPPAAIPVLESLSGRTELAVAEAAARYGFRNYSTDWHQIVEDPAVEVLDNSGPNSVHLPASLAAVSLGKHVICEKPLGMNASESKMLWEAAESAGVKHMTAFNYRFVPAVQFARQLICDGLIGDIRHFRGQYLQPSLVDETSPRLWRLDQTEAGKGVLGDLGSHTVDLARYLVGEPTRVNGIVKTMVPERPSVENPAVMAPVTVDDAYVGLMEFENGAIGTIEGTKYATGRDNFNLFEINGTRGSIAYNQEHMNELQLYTDDVGHDGTDGFRRVTLNQPGQPYAEYWWARGHTIGWEHSFIHELHHFLDCVVNRKSIAPLGATFEDGYRVDVILDAIIESSENNGAGVAINY